MVNRGLFGWKFLNTSFALEGAFYFVARDVGVCRSTRQDVSGGVPHLVEKRA
jgi:hypothetical protein